MSKVIFDISTSLDGFVTASGARMNPWATAQRLHEWAHGDDEKGSEVLAEITEVIKTAAATHMRFRVVG